MTAATRQPGSWPSPVSAALIAQGGLRLAQPSIVMGNVYWLEGRASEKGRTVLMRRSQDRRISEMTPAPINVRSGAHEYGGGVYCVHGDTIFFVDYARQCLCMQKGEAATDMFFESATRRLADLCFDSRHARVLAVSEDHAAEGEALTTLVAISIADGSLHTLAQGADFYSSPVVAPGGRQLAWLEWNHPDMPWDATTLKVAALSDGVEELEPASVAGGPGESIFQPGWGEDGKLYFMSDRSGWWNLHCWDGQQVTALMHENADCGFGQWVFGMSTWGFVSASEVLCCGARAGIWSLAVVDVHTRSTRWLDLPFNTIEHVATAPGRAVLLAASETQALAVIELDTATLEWAIVQESNRCDISPEWISAAVPMRFASAGDESHAFYYPPKNAETNPGNLPPPLLLKCHGGPTAHADAGLDWRIQFWTSRGFAVVDLNYRGSTGFGRAYRQKLHGQWGIADVDDAVSVANYLVDQGLADADRLAISGGSAGGFTVLSALAFREVFKAGTSLYGVSQLESLLNDTHKFEARYLDRLVGPWPESRELYAERSPLDHAAQLACPVLFLQGLKDRVVTPDQSERMADALRSKGLPVLYICFPEEGHGFRQAENIITALEAELYFYARIFGFTPAGITFSMAIDNLDD